jgi:hypothetical protein
MRSVKAWATAAMAIGSLVLSGYAATATITTHEPQATVATPAASAQSVRPALGTATEAVIAQISAEARSPGRLLNANALSAASGAAR